MSRLLFAPLVVATLVWFVFAVRAVNGETPPVPDDPVALVAPPAAVGSAELELELRALRTRLDREHRRYLDARRRARQLTRTLAHTTTTREAIDLACIVYGSCATLWRRASCETGGTFDPKAHNSSGASGLFQFLASTWQSTPFARLSVWSPYANALAAGWMEANGRGGEWDCR